MARLYTREELEEQKNGKKSLADTAKEVQSENPAYTPTSFLDLIALGRKRRMDAKKKQSILDGEKKVSIEELERKKKQEVSTEAVKDWEIGAEDTGLIDSNMGRKGTRVKGKYYPKYVIGGITQAASGVYSTVQGIKDVKAGKSELAGFDKDSLQMKGSLELQKKMDEPISQKLVEAKDVSQKATEATVMGQAAKGGAKSMQAGLAAVLASGKQSDLAAMSQGQAAKDAAQSAMIQQQQLQEQRRMSLSDAELQGIQEKIASGKQNIKSGIEQTGSGLAQIEEDAVRAATAVATGGMSEVAGATTSFNNGGIQRNDNPEVSDGEFSHEKNPIDMVQDGEKVGEMTGGEAIFNPEDTQEMQDLVKKGDAETLLSHMTKLFKRFDKQDMEHSKKEAAKGNKAKKGTRVYKPKMKY